MTDEPPVRAHLGKVLLPYHDREDGWTDETYTPDAARALAGELLSMADEADVQQAKIAAACADGHQWDDGYNSTWGERVTRYHCQREGCEATKDEPGWLPFEPKTHPALTLRGLPIVPESACTGPGCERCSDEAMAEHMRTIFDDAYMSISRDGVQWPRSEAIGEAFRRRDE